MTTDHAVGKDSRTDVPPKFIRGRPALIAWNPWFRFSSQHLRCMATMAIFIHMKTTLNIDDALLAEARRLSRIEEKTALVHAGLEALIARESARRLAALGGSERSLRPVRRRRPGQRAAR